MQRDVLTDRISFERLKNYFERLAVNGGNRTKISNGWKNFEWSEFLTESEQNQKGALHVNNLSAPSPNALVMQNSCVEFFLNFLFYQSLIYILNETK